MPGMEREAEVLSWKRWLTFSTRRPYGLSWRPWEWTFGEEGPKMKRRRRELWDKVSICTGCTSIASIFWTSSVLGMLVRRLYRMAYVATSGLSGGSHDAGTGGRAWISWTAFQKWQKRSLFENTSKLLSLCLPCSQCISMSMSCGCDTFFWSLCQSTEGRLSRVISCFASGGWHESEAEYLTMAHDLKCVRHGPSIFLPSFIFFHIFYQQTFRGFWIFLDLFERPQAQLQRRLSWRHLRPRGIPRCCASSTRLRRRENVNRWKRHFFETVPTDFSPTAGSLGSSAFRWIPPGSKQGSQHISLRGSEQQGSQQGCQQPKGFPIRLQ